MARRSQSKRNGPRANRPRGHRGSGNASIDTPKRVPYATPSGPGAIGGATPAPPGTTIGTLPGALQPPAPPGPPAIPAPEYDSIYTHDRAAADAAYQTTLAGIGLSRSRLGFDTGFGADGQVDLSNPYSQAMLLQRSKEQNTRGINSSMAARGHLYSGARLRAQDENNYQFERNRSNLQTTTQRGYEDLTLAEQQAGNQRSIGYNDADASQAGRWADMQRDWFLRYGNG